MAEWWDSGGGFSLSGAGGNGFDTSWLYGGDTSGLSGYSLGGGGDTSGLSGYSLGGGGGSAAVAPLVTTPPPSGGGSWFSDIMSSLGTGARAVTPLLGIGTAGLGLYSGIKGMQDAAQSKRDNERALEAQRSITDTALGAGNTLTNAGASAMMGGPLPEGLEAQAQQWEDAYRAQVRNYLAKAGQSTSAAAAQWEPYIKQQAAIYRQQLASGLLQPGQQNLALASGSAARSVGQTQATQTGVGTALEAANRALASLAAASGEPERRRTA